MARKTQNAVFSSDGSAYQLTADPASVTTFLEKFNAVTARPRSGYDKYFNDNGFINPISPEGLSPQGVGKLLAKLLEVAYQIIGRGGDDATAMETVLKGVDGYKALAPEFVAKRKRQTQLLHALIALGNSPEADVIRERAEAEGISLPTVEELATANEPE